MSNKVRVRFAPSPTGPLHIGGVRTALYNYLFARKHNGDFILRIEDTDQTRFVPGAEQYIIESLQWCGINFDEGVHIGGSYSPYRQSDRKEIYKKYALQLVENGSAYYAFDTPEELEQMREKLKSMKVASPQYNVITRTSMKNSLTLSDDEVKKLLANNVPYVIRIKIPRKEEIKVNDMIRGWVTFHSSQLDDKVLFKSDGMPTYHLANVVDDYLMKISHVIRGEEWLPSTPIHILLYRYLAWENEMPQFAHLPLLLRPDGNGKLSKRDGDRLGFPVFPLQWKDPVTNETSSGFREAGYFPSALINILVLLGWHASGNREIFSMEELIQEFSFERVSKSGAKFDPEKSKWFNQQYLKQLSNDMLASMVQPVLKQHDISTNSEYVNKVCGLVKERLIFVNEFWEHAKYFFIRPDNYDEKIIKKKWTNNVSELVSELKTVLVSLPTFHAIQIEQACKEHLDKKNISIGTIMPALRVVLCGVGHGPPLFEVVETLGKEESIKRIEIALNELQAVG